MFSVLNGLICLKRSIKIIKNFVTSKFWTVSAFELAFHVPNVDVDVHMFES